MPCPSVKVGAWREDAKGTTGRFPQFQSARGAKSRLRATGGSRRQRRRGKSESQGPLKVPPCLRRPRLNAIIKKCYIDRQFVLRARFEWSSRRSASRRSPSRRSQSAQSPRTPRRRSPSSPRRPVRCPTSRARACWCPKRSRRTRCARISMPTLRRSPRPSRKARASRLSHRLASCPRTKLCSARVIRGGSPSSKRASLRAKRNCGVLRADRRRLAVGIARCDPRVRSAAEVA